LKGGKASTAIFRRSPGTRYAIRLIRLGCEANCADQADRPRKYRWVGAATPTQQKHPPIPSCPRRASDVFYGSNLYRKDKPRWLISNSPETPQVPGAALRLTTPAVPGWDQAVASLGSGLGRVGDTLAERVRGTCGLGIARLIGLPHRGGAWLHAMNDDEARWWRWQVAELRGGLVRQYRDARFEMLRYDPAMRREDPTLIAIQPGSSGPGGTAG
jgi:hypothetical protein